MPNWVSKPSTVRPCGVAITPALVTRIFKVLLFWRKVCAAARTLSRELRSKLRSSTRPGSRMSDRADSPLAVSRTPRKSFAPVADSARAVSMPIPEEQPVMRNTLSESLPSRLSSLTISKAVGRESSTPWGDSWAASYREDIFGTVDRFVTLSKAEGVGYGRESDMGQLTERGSIAGGVALRVEC